MADAEAKANDGLIIEGRIIPRWQPNQLRHNHATDVRKKYGVETARIMLGHSKLDVTEIYAERDQSRMMEIAKMIG